MQTHYLTGYVCKLQGRKFLQPFNGFLSPLLLAAEQEKIRLNSKE